MSQLSRRQILTFFGATAAATALGPPFAWIGARRGGRVEAAGAAWVHGFTPVRVPHPLPIYAIKSSYLSGPGGTGVVLPPTGDPSLSEYTVLDDVVVAPEYEYYTIVKWGDRPFSDSHQYVGYNCDYTGYIPVHGILDGLLWVNHEYASFPFSTLSPGMPANLASAATSFEAVVGFPLPAIKNRELLGELLYNCGGSILRVHLDPQGRYEVVAGHGLNRRIHGLSGLAINGERSDAYRLVTSWGTRSHQQGDANFLIGTGPAATDVFPLSTDGLGNRIIGTAFNCSGATTPWGIVLSAEENFQGSSLFFVGVNEEVKPDGTQLAYLDGTSGLEFGLVGEKYGWIVEVDPHSQARARKHTWLGRFRHENAALRVISGLPLVAYMGDDRRGGHAWKFVSSAPVSHPSSPSNSELFNAGTLFVARFNPDGTGVWIPLLLSTPTNPLTPSQLASEELAALVSAQQNGRIRLPRRNGVAGQTIDGGFFNLDLTNQATALAGYLGKTLGDFYPTQGAVLVDAFPAANLVGGTPCARPEDFEIDPRNHRRVFMAFTDGAPGSDGYPDSRIFVVAKYSSAVNDTQHSGGAYAITEDSADGAGLTFHWERLAQAGEAGAEDGFGFAALDNLAFDPTGHIWGVTDLSTELHNGWGSGLTPARLTVDHSARGNTANLVGVFGNNTLFYTPLGGPDAGFLIPFAYGPVRCEFTGPTFVGGSLIISVQHPGEDVPIGDGTNLVRDIECLNLAGGLFTQTRTVPLGSQWPHDNTKVPRPTVIGIKLRS